MVFAVRGLVVIVPLVGWAPLHPPEAMHECAPVVLHCKVVELPLGTLVLFAARVTAGFAVSLEAAVAVLTVEELVFDVSADDSPQAASAANTAHPSAQPNTRPTNPIPRLRDFRRLHPLPLFFLAGRLAHFDGGIIDCFLGTANLSLFAYLSLICGIFVRPKMLMFKMLMFKRGSNSRRRGRVAASPESRQRRG